jgi:signal transduction histidine kinase/transcriptional regulator with GAF, ATPase, and Fis domain
MQARTQSPTLEESTIFERVARIVSSVRGTNPNYAHLASELETAIPFDVFGIALLRHDRQAVRVSVCKRVANSWQASYHQHPFADSMVERILNARTEPIVPDVVSSTEDAAEIIINNYPAGLDDSPASSGDALSGNPQLHATLIVPLVVADHVLGTLELGSIRHNAYADETLQRLIRAVARVLAAAIESAQVGGSVEIQDRQRQELKSVSSALTSDMDLSGILNRIVVGIANALNVASAIITLNQRNGALYLQAQSGLNDTELQKVISCEVASSEQSILGFTLRRRQPCVSQNIAEDERFPLSSGFASQLAVHSIFSHPLLTGSTVYGALLLCSPEPGGFTPLKADILSLFADQATIAIHNGMLLEAARERRRFQEEIEQLELLQRKNPVVPQVEDEQALLNHIREEAEHIFGISFSNYLRIVSNKMLTLRERNILRDAAVSSVSADILEFSDWPEQHEDAGIHPSQLQEEQTSSLMQTVEASLARAGLLGNVGAAIGTLDPDPSYPRENTAYTQINETLVRTIGNPLFVTDLFGRCIYVTPAAEGFCGMRLVGRPHPFDDSASDVLHLASSISLQEAFATLLPRIRNASEVLSYLQSFTLQQLDENNSLDTIQGDEDAHSMRLFPDSLPTNTLRCVIAVEPIQNTSHLDVFAGTNHIMSEDYQLSMDETPELEHIPPRMLLDGAPSDRHYRLKRYPLYDQNGQLIATALQVQDITEQVRDEKNRSALLSSVSHDLRTPLTTIKAAVTGLMQPGVEWDAEMLREILEEIDAETDHLDMLVNSLVDMSRIEMGALVLEKEWCDIVELVHGTLSHIERILHERSIRTAFRPQLPLIQADYVQLGRVFRNLIENAARYSPAGAEILITLDVVSREELAGDLPENSRQYLRAQVIDQGRGVPEEERIRIFRSFYHLDSSGSGLGLAICRGIVEAHQGRIWVEPASHGGSRFVFVLPIIS